MKDNYYDFTCTELNAKAYIDYMLNRTQSMFKWENLPDTIDERTLERRLQENGFVVFLRINEDEIQPFEERKQDGGIYAMDGNYGGVLDFNGNPQYCIVAHPLLIDAKKVRINEDCVLARNDSKMLGLLPLFYRYAKAIAENDLSLFRADQQTRATAIISANDNKGLESARRYIESIKQGDLGVVIQESKAAPSVRTQPFFTEAGNQLTNLIELEQFLKGSWFNEIGINANFNMKRETILESESDLNSEAIQPLVDQMLHERERACELINGIFGLNVSVHLHSAWNKEQKMHEGDDMNKEEELKNLGYLTKGETDELAGSDEQEIKEESTVDGEEVLEEVAEERGEEEPVAEVPEIEEEPLEEETPEVEVNIEIDSAEDVTVEDDKEEEKEDGITD